MDHWLLLALGALFAWTITDTMDKHIMTDELKDPILSATIYCLMVFIIFSIAGTLLGNAFSISAHARYVGITIGLIYGLAIFFYYRALQGEEISRLAMLFALVPVVVLIFAGLFLKEVLTQIQYYGIFLLVIGALVSHIKNHSRGHRLNITILFVILAVFCFASRDLLVKFVTAETTIFNILPWMGLGATVIPAILFAIYHLHIRSKLKLRGAEHLFLNAALGGTGLMMYMISISIGKVSIVSAIVHILPLTVFIFATLLSKFFPKIIREEITKNILIVKIFALLLVIFGGILLVI